MQTTITRRVRGEMIRPWVFLIAALALSSLGIAPSRDAFAEDRADELHPKARAFFEEYRRKVHRGAFALSINGNSAGYNYCPKTGMCGVQRHKLFRSAIQSCRVHSDGVPCKIFAWRGNIIWEGKIPGPRKASCQSKDQRNDFADAHRGRGNVTVNEDVAKAYDSFRTQKGTGYFAMTLTGSSHSYQMCEFTDCDFTLCLERARANCSRYAGTECLILADKIGIVWRGDVRGPDGADLNQTISD